jgi:rhamnogalacturonan acetylesterase
MKTIKIKTWIYLFAVLLASCGAAKLLTDDQKPSFYIIGDSTVRNGDGTGKGEQWGWGSFIADYFHTTKINIRNEAIGGRSSRTFLTEGRWDKILATLKAGDYVIMQFGHNDGGALDDTARARGTIKGIGEEVKEVYNPIMKKQEVVHTYGWYIRKYVQDAKAKRAIPIVCSLIPRNDWRNGKVIRADDNYSKWAREVATAQGVDFIDLNNLVAAKYEEMSAEKVKLYFPVDHTHTNLDGAKLNAEIVVKSLKELKLRGLKKYMK